MKKEWHILVSVMQMNYKVKGAILVVVGDDGGILRADVGILGNGNVHPGAAAKIRQQLQNKNN